MYHEAFTEASMEQLKEEKKWVNNIPAVLQSFIFSNGYCNRQIRLHCYFGHMSFKKLFHWVRFVDIVIFLTFCLSQVNNSNITMALRRGIHLSFP